jgi:bifunctional non-homologous end joining protein LigD
MTGANGKPFGERLPRRRTSNEGIRCSEVLMSLEEYRKKRDFRVTPEPAGGKPHASGGGKLTYTIQKHEATNLHYDLRLQWNGVLLSWAIPKGPSLDPSVKRFAVRTEDHPIEYAKFEGVVPGGEYGAGTVMLWDEGTWVPDDPDVDASLRKGDLKFALYGKKLKGSWVLVKTRGYGRSSWLLIKHRDAFAAARDITAEEPDSASSRRSLAQIAKDGGGNVEKAAAGDPVKKTRGAARARPARAGSQRS